MKEERSPVEPNEKKKSDKKSEKVGRAVVLSLPPIATTPQKAIVL